MVPFYVLFHIYAWKVNYTFHKGLATDKQTTPNMIKFYQLKDLKGTKNTFIFFSHTSNFISLAGLPPCLLPRLWWHSLNKSCANSFLFS